MAQAAASAHVHKRKMAKDVLVFHEALAPLWHVTPGAARAVAACAQADRLLTLAKDIQSTNARQLQLAINTFKQACIASAGTADAAFSDVHSAFHQSVQ
jgi:hypothetical protein